MANPAAPAGFGGLGSATFTLAVNEEPLKKGMKKVFAEVQTTSAQIQSSLDKASFNGSRSLLQLAYACDDLQYGFRSVVNNIPQMLMFLGPGIAGAAGVGAVAVNLMITHWGTLTSTMQAAWSDVPLAQLERIRLATEAATEAFDKLTKAPTRAMAAQAKGVEEVLKEGPAGKIFADMVGQALSEIPREIWVNKGNIPDNPLQVSPQDKLDEERLEKARKLAAERMGRIMSDDPGVSKAAIAGVGDPGLRRRLMNETPEGQERIAQQRLEAQGEHQGRLLADKLKEQARAEQIQQRGWEIEGRENGKRWEAKREAQAKDTASQMMRSPLGLNVLSGQLPKEADVQKMLKAAKSDADPAKVLKDLSKVSQEDIRKKMLEGGFSRQRATQELMLENVMRNDPDFGRQSKRESQFMGLAEFAKNLQTGALGPDKLLTAAQEHNRLLKLLIDKTVPPAWR
jgi:hypothetical protein